MTFILPLKMTNDGAWGENFRYNKNLKKNPKKIVKMLFAVFNKTCFREKVILRERETNTFFKV